MDVNDIPMPKASATTPKRMAKSMVRRILNGDWAEITEVRISTGTSSATAKVNTGLWIFSAT